MNIIIKIIIGYLILMFGSKVISYLFFAYPQIVVPIIFVIMIIGFFLLLGLAPKSNSKSINQKYIEDKEKSHNDFMRDERQREQNEAYAAKIELEYG